MLQRPRQSPGAVWQPYRASDTATGILIGPGELSLVRDTRTIDDLAEIDVVMLLFGVGLESSLVRLKHIQRTFWVGGGLRISLTVAVSTLILGFLGISTTWAGFGRSWSVAARWRIGRDRVAGRAERRQPVREFLGLKRLRPATPGRGWRRRR